jgi:hypothetical protein
MRVNDFDCNALCDLGASISVVPRKIYDILGLPPLENCYVDVHLSDIAKKKPFGRINDFLIIVNNNLVPVDFLVVDIECNASCSIILGRPFFLELLVLLLIRKKVPLDINSHSRKEWNTFLEREKSTF